MWEEAAFTSEGLWKELTRYGVCWKSFHVQIRTQPLNRTDSGRGVWKVSGEWIEKGGGAATPSHYFSYWTLSSESKKQSL